MALRWPSTDQEYRIELDLMCHAAPLPEVQQIARAAEAAGFGTMWVTESARTAYLSCTAAALVTERIGLGTGIAVAFPRSPMVTASVAWELAEATGGRVFFPYSTSQLSKSFIEIEEELRSQYNLAYKPTNFRKNGTYRKIKVKVDWNDITTRHRKGYYAPTLEGDE